MGIDGFCQANQRVREGGSFWAYLGATFGLFTVVYTVVFIYTPSHRGGYLALGKKIFAWGGGYLLTYVVLKISKFWGLFMKLFELRAAAYNSGIHIASISAMAGLSSSIGHFGDIAGITFNRTTGNLVTGHKRVNELKRLYGGDLDVVEDGHDRGHILCPNGDTFAVRFVDWSVEKEKIANVTANNPEIAGVFTVQARDFIAGLESPPAELMLDKLMAGIRIPDEIGTEKRSRPACELPDDLPDDDDVDEAVAKDLGYTDLDLAAGTDKAEKRDAYPVYFMLEKQDYGRFKKVAGDDPEAWFHGVLWTE